jgi:hypothetical protein
MMLAVLVALLLPALLLKLAHPAAVLSYTAAHALLVAWAAASRTGGLLLHTTALVETA